MMENMHLTAVSLGLGSVFIRGMFRSLESDSQAQKMLQVPADWKALCGLAAGYDPAMSNHPAVFHSLPVHRIE
jgi:nitroreductase